MERKRDKLLDGLERYVADSVGFEGADRIHEYREMLRLIECGYGSIIKLRERADISKSEPSVRVAAYIAAISGGHDGLLDEMSRAAVTDDGFDIGVTRLLEDENGNR